MSESISIIEHIGKNYSKVVAVVIFHYGFYLLTTQSWGFFRHVLGPPSNLGVWIMSRLFNFLCDQI